MTYDLDDILDRIEYLQAREADGTPLTREDQAELEALMIEGSAAERMMGVDEKDD